MPVGRNVHCAGHTADLADQTPADARPGLMLGQGIQAYIHHPIAATMALDVAGDMAASEPFRGTARRE